MPQNLKGIPKKSVAVFLAADDGSLIFDDNDNTYLVIRLADALKAIIKNLGTLKNITKNTGALKKINKS
jgi:hypothetical protein